MKQKKVRTASVAVAATSAAVEEKLETVVDHEYPSDSFPFHSKSLNHSKANEEQKKK